MTDDAALILLTFDRLSPLQLTAYGNEDADTPRFDEMLKRADVYYEFYAQPGYLSPQLDRMLEDLKSAQVNSVRLSIESADAIQNHMVPPRSFTRVELKIDNAAPADVVEKYVEAVFESLAVPENCWWIITADRGGDLEEWKDLNAGFTAAFAESLTRRLWAPLIIVRPDRDRNARRHQQLLTTGDLISTIYDVLQIPRSAGSNEFSAFDETHRSELLLTDSETCGLRTPDRLLVAPRKLLEDPAALEFSTDWPRLFIKPDDRFDVNNLAVNEPERTAELLHRLQELLTHSGK